MKKENLQILRYPHSCSLCNWLGGDLTFKYKAAPKISLTITMKDSKSLLTETDRHAETAEAIIQLAADSCKNRHKYLHKQNPSGKTQNIFL